MIDATTAARENLKDREVSGWDLHSDDRDLVDMYRRDPDDEVHAPVRGQEQPA